MALQLQLVFSKTDEKKNDLAVLKHQLNDEIKALAEYQKILDEEAALKLKKQQIILSVKQNNREMIDKMDSLKIDLDSNKQMLSDVALSDFIAGKDIRVTDRNGFIMEPIFTVKYRKTGEIADKKSNSIKISKKDIPDDDAEMFFARREKRVYHAQTVISGYQMMIDTRSNEMIDCYTRQLVMKLGASLLESKEIEVRSHKNHNGDLVLETIIRI
jgi:hypothetical protein